MVSKALRRAATSTWLLIVSAMFFTVGLVGGTTASFTAEDDSTTATYAGGWVDPPSNPTLTASGYDGVLAWTPGTTGVLNQSILVADRNGNDSCPNKYTTTVTSTEPGNEAAYTDSGRASASGANGDYFCYGLVSTYDSWFSATTTVGPLQLGVVPVSMTLANGGASGSLDAGDTITLTFNQPMSLASGSIAVEACGSAGTIRLGASKCSGANTFGQLSGLTVNGGNGNTAFGSSSIAIVSGATVQITLGGAGAATATGTATFKATSGETAVTSSSGSASSCTAASTCQPSATANF